MPSFIKISDPKDVHSPYQIAMCVWGSGSRRTQLQLSGVLKPQLSKFGIYWGFERRSVYIGTSEPSCDVKEQDQVFDIRPRYFAEQF